ESLATSELVRELAQAMNKPARLIPFPVPIMRGMARLIGKTGEIDRLTSSLVVGTKKIRTQLGWSPPWSVSEGIRVTVTWFQQNPEESKNRGSPVVLVLKLLAYALLSALLTWSVRRYSLRNKIIDTPNERSSHTIPTPRGGGLGFVAL